MSVPLGRSLGSELGVIVLFTILAKQISKKRMQPVASMRKRSSRIKEEIMQLL